MSVPQPEGSSRSLGRTIEIIATIAMAFAVIAIIAPLIGTNGLRITDSPNQRDAAMTVVGTPVFAVDVGDPLPTQVDDDGTVNVGGQPVVEIVEPVTVTAAMLDPTASQRIAWLIWQVSGPLLALAIALPIRQMARSTYAGDPFTTANERRLWRLSGLVMVGGILVGIVGGIARMLILQRSAAADLFEIEFTLDFSPIFIGLVIAALASVWRVGVGMRDELDATV